MDKIHEQYAFDTSVRPPQYVRHEFFLESSGHIQHVTDGQPRARIPRKSWDDYAENCPPMEQAIHEAFESVSLADLAADNPALPEKLDTAE